MFENLVGVCVFQAISLVCGLLYCSTIYLAGIVATKYLSLIKVVYAMTKVQI